jgi:hypothetical protein
VSHAVTLLRACRDGPRGGAAEKGDELAPSHVRPPTNEEMLTMKATTLDTPRVCDVRHPQNGQRT